jgi:hypothetical protein
VMDGLSAGEQVVTSGQFLIDSESRLQEAVQKMLAPKPAADVGHEMPEADDPHAGHEMPEADDPHPGHEMEGQAGAAGMHEGHAGD